MAIAFEKPLKDFLKNFQKDLSQLQKTLKKESDQLLKKVKTSTQKDSLQAKRSEIEKLIEKNLKKYEPTINKFVADVHKSAKKAGIDLTDIEQKVKDNLHYARERLSKTSLGKKVAKGQGKKAAVKKATPTRKAKPSTGKGPGNEAN